MSILNTSRSSFSIFSDTLKSFASLGQSYDHFDRCSLELSLGAFSFDTSGVDDLVRTSGGDEPVRTSDLMAGCRAGLKRLSERPYLV